MLEAYWEHLKAFGATLWREPDLDREMTSLAILGMDFDLPLL